MSGSEVRKEYSRLRSTANKRLERLEKQGLGTRGSYRFPTLSEIDTGRSTPESMLADVSNFIRSPRTTVRGEKQFLASFKDAMKERGYDSLVKDNATAYKTIEFLDQVRERYSAKIYDSGDTLDVMEQAERLNVPEEMLQRNIDFFIENAERLESVKASKDNRAFSQKRLNTLMKKWK